MRSSETSVTRKQIPLVLALRRFNWIEQAAIPIIIAIMETQPIIIVLMILSRALTGTTQPWPLEAYTVTLLLITLHWWAMFVERLRQQAIPHQRMQLLRVIGLLLACVIVLLTHLALLTNLLAPLFMIALVTWTWKRGIDKARAGLNDENLVPTFRIGFMVLLFSFLFTVLLMNGSDTPQIYSGIFVFLGNAFPIFFFSGLLALSFTRIALIRCDNTHSSSSIFDPTRAWLIVLTLAWLLLLAVVIGLETFSFQSIVDFFQPLWLLLGIIVSFLLDIFFFLFAPLTQFFIGIFGVPTHMLPVPSRPVKQQPVTAPTIPPEVFLIGRIVLLLLLLILFMLIVRFILKRWQARQFVDDSEEEIRETLPIRSLLKARRESRPAHSERISELEPLPPGSARARYRELLQALAWNKETLARRANETPSEYQARLLAQLPQTPSTDLEQGEAGNDSTTLAMLTNDYTRERYGGKAGEHKEGPYSQSWLAHFIKRLVGTSSR